MQRLPDTSSWTKPEVDPISGEMKQVPISRKERIFVLAYIRTLDVQKAAREAGYRASPQYMDQAGREILGKPYIRAIIDRETEKALLSVPDVVHRLKEQATANMADFFKDEHSILPDGTVLNTKVVNWEFLEEKGYLVKKFIQDDKGKITLELYDAQAALNMIGKHIHLFEDQLDLQDLGDIIIKVVKGVHYDDL
jgi:hypothetical protein